MTLLFLALWMLCGFGATVLAAVAARGWWTVGIAVAGFVLGAVSAGANLAVDPSWVATLAALVAVLALVWPEHWTAIRPTSVVHPTEEGPYGGPRRAERAKQILPSSQGLRVRTSIRALGWIVTGVSCGALAGIWSVLFQAQGLPPAAAVIAAAAVPALSAWLARRRPVFAPPRLRDEALLAVVVLGVAVAVAPGALDGWRDALALAVDARSAGGSVPSWTVAFSIGALASGGLYAAWSRR